MKYTSEQIQAAREKVAFDWRSLGYAIRKEDAYASHVTEEQKDQFLAKHLKYASEISDGKHDGCFTIAQRIRIALGEPCHALLPKY